MLKSDPKEAKGSGERGYEQGRGFIAFVLTKG